VHTFKVIHAHRRRSGPLGRDGSRRPADYSFRRCAPCSRSRPPAPATPREGHAWCGCRKERGGILSALAEIIHRSGERAGGSRHPAHRLTYVYHGNLPAPEHERRFQETFASTPRARARVSAQFVMKELADVNRPFALSYAIDGRLAEVRSPCRTSRAVDGGRPGLGGCVDASLMRALDY